MDTVEQRCTVDSLELKEEVTCTDFEETEGDKSLKIMIEILETERRN